MVTLRIVYWTLFLAIGAALDLSAPATAATNSANEEKAVMLTMEQLAKATVDKNVSALGKLYHKNLNFIHGSSQTENKTEVLEQAPSRPIAEMKYGNAAVHVYGNAALVNSDMELTLVSAGKTTNLVDNTTFVLIKEDGRWQIVSRQVTSGKRTK